MRRRSRFALLRFTSDYLPVVNAQTASPTISTTTAPDAATDFAARKASGDERHGDIRCQTPVVETDIDQILVALAFFTAWRSEFDPVIPRERPVLLWTGLLDEISNEPDGTVRDQTLVDLACGAMQLCNLLLDLIAERAESSRDEMLSRIARRIQETSG